ncbi:AI-2E family transporter [Streptomyces sp. CA-106131]|uniref:AI-2E family transporter n=1 Tax=Streptomyces sp. CA-106131 TaxID=3240045 RepID=UPI003D8C4599
MVNRAVLAHRLFTGISRRHLACLIEELAQPWQAGVEGRRHEARGRPRRRAAGAGARAVSAGPHSTGWPANLSFLVERRSAEHFLAAVDENRTGRFLLGNIATSAIAGLATFAWCWAVSVPYPAALGVFVALMDLVPIVGSTLAGVIVSLVALSVSLLIAGLTAGFYTAFRLAEDYLIMPRAMKYAVDVHPIVTIVGVLVGGALLGIIGALVAIPVAVAIGIILDEYVFTRTDAS